MIVLKNYVKIAWRNLKRNMGYSIINISGLSVGVATVMLIGFWLYDELTFNQGHDNYDHIAQVLMHKTANNRTRTSEVVPFPLGNELRHTYGSNFEQVVMSSYLGDNILSVSDKHLTVSGSYMEPGILEMLSLQMIQGDWTALNDPNSIVISKSTSEAFFGTKNPIGITMEIGNKLPVTVTGVYEDLPANAKFYDLKFIAPWDLYASYYDWVRRARDLNLWGNNSYELYVQISKAGNMADIGTKIKDVVSDNLSKNQRDTEIALVLHPMKNWHLKSDWANGVNTGGFIQYVWLFGIIGCFVLLLACINFMNLSTAQSEKRAKEVGIRKSIGSSKKQLVSQFLGEALLVVVLSFILAIFLVLLALPAFNLLTNKQIGFPFSKVLFWVSSMLFIGITALLAGSYPALYLSSFKPVKALKGMFRTGTSATSFRKTLVVIQFTVSIILIIGTVVVQLQIDNSKNRPLGYEREGLVMIEKVTEDYEGKYNLLRDELIKQGGVVDMAASSSPLTGLWSNGGGFEWEGKSPDFVTSLFTVSVSHDYGNTIGWELLEGRDFSRDFSNDSTAFILNEAAVDYMGIKDPIGKRIRSNNQEHEVIGVVKNMVAQSPFQPVKQAVYMINYENTNWIELKLDPQKSISESLAITETVFKKHIPKTPFEYQFVNESFSKKFISEERTRKLSSVFAFLAIFISCLGLLGLTAFVAEQRTKEIGVRKVLGASIFTIWKMLSKDFVYLVLISCSIALPLGHYLMNEWLKNYQYRIEIPWWLLLGAVMAALLITLLTVSFHGIRAAQKNPVKSLRTE